ncbi:hypothetical protein CDAR_198601 [Caerostris darwini]|uniref:Uncharacterized protein n=1 Tax=Caerostris darwini TaxID=1538125 RepID=A0AAV4W5Q9_9ARAC|nr:hypothetical protein CDAR_198601 [Caerostris darwini]
MPLEDNERRKRNRVGFIPRSSIFSPRYTDLFLLGALETQFSTRVGAAMKPKQRTCSHSGEITGNPKRSPEHRGCRVRSASDLSADANACRHVYLLQRKHFSPKRKSSYVFLRLRKHGTRATAAAGARTSPTSNNERKKALLILWRDARLVTSVRLINALHPRVARISKRVASENDFCPWHIMGEGEGQSDCDVGRQLMEKVTPGWFKVDSSSSSLSMAPPSLRRSPFTLTRRFAP